MAGAVVAAKAMLTLADKKTLKRILITTAVILAALLLLVLAVPLLIILTLFMLLSPTGDELQKDVFYQSIQSVRTEYKIDGTLPVSVVKTTHFILHGDKPVSSAEAAAFVKQYFVETAVTEETREVPIEGSATGETRTVTTRRTVHSFLSLDALTALLQNPPFAFSPQDIRLIQLLYDPGADAPPAQGGTELPDSLLSLVQGGGAHLTQRYHGTGRGAGVDIGALSGTPVLAAFDGRVDYYLWKNWQGALVSLGAVAFLHSEDDRTTAIYAHLSQFDTPQSGVYIASFPSVQQFSPNLEVFQYSKPVKKGDVIGAVGNTGNSFGAHLHFGWMVDGVARNPMG